MLSGCLVAWPACCLAAQMLAVAGWRSLRALRISSSMPCRRCSAKQDMPLLPGLQAERVVIECLRGNEELAMEKVRCPFALLSSGAIA